MTTPRPLRAPAHALAKCPGCKLPATAIERASHHKEPGFEHVTYQCETCPGPFDKGRRRWRKKERILTEIETELRARGEKRGGG